MKVTHLRLWVCTDWGPAGTTPPCGTHAACAYSSTGSKETRCEQHLSVSRTDRGLPRTLPSTLGWGWGVKALRLAALWGDGAKLRHQVTLAGEPEVISRCQVVPGTCPFAGGETRVDRRAACCEAVTQSPSTACSWRANVTTGDGPAHPIPSTPRLLLASPRLAGRLCPSRLPGQTHVCARAHNVLPCGLVPPTPPGLQACGYHTEF